MKKTFYYSLPGAFSGIITAAVFFIPFYKDVTETFYIKFAATAALFCAVFVLSHRMISAAISRLNVVPLEKELKINGLIFAIPSAAASAVPLYYYLYPRFQGADFLMLGNIYLPWGGFIKTGAAGYGMLACAGFLMALVLFIMMFRYLKAVYFSKTCSNPCLKILTAFFIFFSAAGLYITAVYPPTGDEPHYLIIARSLASDFDADLKNNYENQDSYRDFYPAFLEYENIHNTPGKNSGGIYSLHSIGLPALISPFFLAGGRIGVMMFMAFIAALAVMLLFMIMTSLDFGMQRSLLFASIYGIAAPFSVNSSLVLTEIPSVLIVLYCIRLLVSGKGNSIIFFAGIGFLPWLHSKYALLSGVIYLLRYIILFREKKFRIQDEAANNAVIAASAAVFFIHYFHIYGKPAGTALSDIFVSSSFYFIFSVKHALKAFFAILADRNFGILFYAPVYFFTAWGIIRAAAEKNFKMLIPAFIGLPYMCVFLFWSDWGGSMAPARQLIPGVFAFALYAAYFDKKYKLSDTKVFRTASVYSAAAVFFMSCMPFLRYASTKDKIFSFLNGHGFNLGWFFADFRDNIGFIHILYVISVIIFTAAGYKYAKRGRNT